MFRATARELLGGQKPCRPQNREPDVPYHFFSSHLSTYDFLTGSGSEALRETKERHNQLPAGSILDPAAPSPISGREINTSLCMLCVPMQPLGAVALQLMNYSSFPSGFALSEP